MYLSKKRKSFTIVISCAFVHSSVSQSKQQRLTEDRAAVNATLEIARGFISDTVGTVTEVADMAKVRA